MAVSTPTIQPSFYENVSKAGSWIVNKTQSFAANAGATAKSVSESVWAFFTKIAGSIAYYLSAAKDVTVTAFGKTKDAFVALPRQHQYAIGGAVALTALAATYLCLRNKGEAKPADPASKEV
jgi:hypothetical protein